MAKSFGAWLKEELDLRNMKQTEFGELINETRSNVNGWIKERAEPRPETLKIIASVFGCTIEDIKTGKRTDGGVFKVILPREGRYFYVPYLDIKLTCAAGVSRLDVEEDPEPFRLKDLSSFDHPEFLAVVRATDSANEPLVTKGHKVLLNTETRSILTSGIYALVVNKRFIIANISVPMVGEVKLEPLNKDFPGVDLSKSVLDELSVIGVVEAVGWTQLKQ